MEFVLAPQRAGHGIETLKSQVLGGHAVWILDFDCCRYMNPDADGTEQAVVAFYENDPYYPRPGRDSVADQMLWG